MHQRLVQRNVRVADLHVLADHRYVHLGIGGEFRVDDPLPVRQVGRRRLDAQAVEDDVVQALLVQQQRDLVDVVGVHGRDHGPLLDVGEQRDLAPLLVRQLVAAAAQQHVGLDADRTQFLDRVLGGLGLDLAAADDRHQRQVHEHAVVAAELDRHLPDRLQERQRLDVADRAADLDHADVRLAGTELDAAPDLVGDVRNDLNRRAEVVAAPLLGDDALVDPPRGEVRIARRGRAHEALVVAEVEIGLGAVVGDEHLTVLERAHGARIDVDVRVELDQADLEAAVLEDGAERRRGDALAQRGNHTAGNEHETRHEYTRRNGVEKDGAGPHRAMRRPAPGIHDRRQARPRVGGGAGGCGRAWREGCARHA